MNRPQMQQILLVLLLIAFIAVWMMNYGGSKPSAETLNSLQWAPLGASINSEIVPLEEDLPVSSRIKGVPPIYRDPFTLPDPLTKLLTQREKERETFEHGTPGPITPQRRRGMPDLTLQGIFWGLAQPQAIINRQILSVGDKVNGVEIVAVKKDAVTVSYEGRTFDMTLPKTNTGRTQIR